MARSSSAFTLMSEFAGVLSLLGAAAEVLVGIWGT